MQKQPSKAFSILIEERKNCIFATARHGEIVVCDVKTRDNARCGICGKSQHLHEISREEPLAIVATGKYVGEGFDYPRLDTLFLALPISWKGLVAQYAGRLHRENEGKKDVRIYDYIDIHEPVCDNMYRIKQKPIINLHLSVR